MKFSGKVWSDHGTTWFNSESVRVNGSAGRRSSCLLSLAIAQTTGVNKSLSVAGWQQITGHSSELVPFARWQHSTGVNKSVA